jgi:hypothetical protein
MINLARHTNLAWSAGIIDGEGCIFIHLQKRKHRPLPSYVINLRVKMTHKVTVNKLQDIFNCGSIYIGKTPKFKNTYSWTVASTNAEYVIGQILPFLVTKKEQAETIMEFASIPKHKGYPGNSRSHEYIERQHSYYLKLKELKHEGN